jgi:hypothetical protein
LTIWGFKEDWSAEVVLGVAALYISLGGFAVAIAEIRRAATVTTATEDAIKQTLTGVRASRLGITITQLRQTVNDLEEATIAKDTVGARRALNAWQYLAAEARGPLGKRFPDRQDLIVSLNQTLELGQGIKGLLAEAEGQALWPITESALTSMALVSNELAAMLEELIPTIQETHEHA